MRFRRADGKLPVWGWLMSYADMATILLALFIVVSVLSRDQTGVTLYRGTGAYRAAVSRFAHLESSSASPPAGEDPPSWWEQVEAEERCQQLLLELGRQQHPVLRLPGQSAQLIIDLYQPLNAKAPYLGEQHREALMRLVPFLQRPDYRVQVVVWATTPAPSAWSRASEQAQGVCAEFLAAASLEVEAADRMIGLGQPWRYREIRRPVLSLMLLRAE